MYTEEELNTNKRCYEMSASKYQENSSLYEKNDRAVLGNFMYELTKFKNPRILVLGIGDCRVANKLKEIGEVYGIDFCSKFVELSKKYDIPCIEGEFLSTNIDGIGKFHGILCASFLHLFKEYDVKKALNKIRSVMYDGGILFVGQPLFKNDIGWIKEKKKSNSNQYRYHLVHNLDWWTDIITECKFLNISLVKTLDGTDDNKIWWDSVWKKI